MRHASVAGGGLLASAVETRWVPGGETRAAAGAAASAESGLGSWRQLPVGGSGAGGAQRPQHAGPARRDGDGGGGAAACAAGPPPQQPGWSADGAAEAALREAASPVNVFEQASEGYGYASGSVTRLAHVATPPLLGGPPMLGWQGFATEGDLLQVRSGTAAEVYRAGAWLAGEEPRRSTPCASCPGARHHA
jgi:hypothetical protein